MARESAQIGMNRAELLSFLTTQRKVALATLESDGTLWCSVESFTVEDEQLCIAVDPKSRAAANLSADPRVCGVVESASTNYYEIRSALIHGVAREGADGGRYVDLEDVISFDFSKINARF